MKKMLVLCYSMYGHIETLAQGARNVDGIAVALKRVAETMTDLAGEIADPKELGDYDAIVFGTPTRFGDMAGQMRTFLDQPLG